MNEMVEWLLALLNTPSPSGDTEVAIQSLQAQAQTLGYQTERSHKGGLLIHVPGQDTEKTRFVTAHVDTLGAMVKEILPTGRLRLDKIGGYAWNTIEGEYCGIQTAQGALFTGTIMLHNTSVHVNREVEKTERSQSNIEVVIDEKVESADDVRSLGISVGDFVYLDPRAVQTPAGYIKSRHLDDKASVAILFHTLKQLQTQRITLPHAVTFLISNNEEIGYGGNSNIPLSTVEYLAVDMGAMGDGQTTTEQVVSICAKDASGPYHLGLRRHLVSLCEQHAIAYKVDLYPYYGSDASAAIHAGHDIVHGLIGPGVANSHAYERTHVEGLDATYRLLLAYLQSPLL